MIDTMDELSVALRDIQACRVTTLHLTFTPGFTARLTDAALLEALVTGLPMVEGLAHRIVRSRGRGAVLTAKLRYRQGVRMLDCYRGSRRWTLTNEENASLAEACAAVMPALPLENEQARFDFLYDLVCRRVTYVHTAPGRKGYERLVGAASVFRDGRANCQGFSDLLYLLCGLCGLEVEYRCQQGERHLHMWNRVRLNGQWHDADASRGARKNPDAALHD
ncbi:MAG: transglutaminase domain-containing protein [Clostridiales bacterium]|nr:transglutaminase domain-containing protein [Clostridiales bacterium]